jgi:hypothetical protein
VRKMSPLSKCVKNRSRSEQYIKNLNSLIIICTEKNALINLHSDVFIDIVQKPVSSLLIFFFCSSID